MPTSWDWGINVLHLTPTCITCSYQSVSISANTISTPHLNLLLLCWREFMSYQIGFTARTLTVLRSKFQEKRNELKCITTFFRFKMHYHFQLSHSIKWLVCKNSIDIQSITATSNIHIAWNPLLNQIKRQLPANTKEETHCKISDFQYRKKKWTRKLADFYSSKNHRLYPVFRNSEINNTVGIIQFIVWIRSEPIHSNVVRGIIRCSNQTSPWRQKDTTNGTTSWQI